MRSGRIHTCVLVCLVSLAAGVRDAAARHWPDPPAWWARAAQCVHQHESPDWHIHNWPYSGGYQFLDSTWSVVGGRGSAGDASPAEQTYRAWLLYERVGWSAWPNTSWVCGLR